MVETGYPLTDEFSQGTPYSTPNIMSLFQFAAARATTAAEITTASTITTTLFLCQTALQPAVRYSPTDTLESFSTCVLGVADSQGAACNLLLKQILLVEEEDDGGVCEPLVVADGVKQLHALMHTVL